MLTVEAPAKLNITLEVLGKRPDGYHEVRSVMQAVSLCDRLNFGLSDRLVINCDMPGWDVSSSLVSRAIELFKLASGYSGGVTIDIEKRIPLLPGLGGDSSDAAATLEGLHKLWESGLSRAKLLGLAGQLGSDVPFFLRGGTALAEGGGEILTSLPPLPHRWVVLVAPDVPLQPGKTGKLYGSLKPKHYTNGRTTEGLAKALRESKVSSLSVFNVFENVAYEEFPGLSVYRERILNLGAAEVHLAGSGPTLFTLFEDKSEAESLYSHCKQQGMEAFLAETI